MNGRVRLLRIVFVVVFLAVAGKAVALTSTQGKLARIAVDQQVRQVVIPAPRGSILDRDGDALAMGQQKRTIYATPYLLTDPQQTADQIAAVLHLKRRARHDLETTLANKESGFAYVARKVDQTLSDRVLALDIPGVGSYAEEQRVYPMQHVASQLVGYAGVDNKGLAGLELLYDKQLAGAAGRQVVVQDPGGNALKTISSTQPTSGADVRLTIDKGIQFTAESVLADTVRRFHAKGGTAIVMNPGTGEIYAMANVPLLDANKFGSQPQAQRNRAVTDSYEPGSTFKMVTIAGALSDDLVTPSTSFVLPYQKQIGDRVIHDAELRGTQRFTVRQILARSSNVGAVMVGELLGKQRLLDWISRLGFGHRTGIDYPGEVYGIVLPADQWSLSTIGNVPMGQGIAVTPIQMATAYSAIANDGVMLRPYVTAQVGTTKHKAVPGRRVVSVKVARQLRSMLADVVSDGTGTEAQITGFQVAGKTGTAQKPLPNGGGYSNYNYVASFVGMVPAGDPQLVVLVMVDEPHPYWGGVVAAPAFRQIATFALQRLEIAP